jgi:proton-dependent oligopeptide transporter, POT family
MMGMWFLASAYGQYVAGLFGSDIVEKLKNPTAMEGLLVYTQSYQEMGWYAVGSGVLLIAISPLIRKLMQDVS